MNKILIFGGSFDPIHYGHLNPLIKVQETFHFDKVILVPCKQQVLKQKSAQTAAFHRVKMLELALKTNPLYKNFQIDLSEINRETPSYTVLTLEYFRKQFTESASLSLLMGEDAFAELPRWFQWEKIVELANILVIDRPGSKKTKAPFPGHETMNPEDILKTPHGLIAHFNAGDYLFSSTTLRLDLATGCNVHEATPAEVFKYIQDNQLYAS